MVDWYYINERGEQVGPVGRNLLEEMLRIELLPSSTLVRPENSGEWRPACEAFSLAASSCEVSPEQESRTDVSDDRISTSEEEPETGGYVSPPEDLDSKIAERARLAGMQRVSAICWIILGIIQIAVCIFAVAGIWNLAGGAARLDLAVRIAAGDHDIPAVYRRARRGLIATGIVNLLLGGAVGLAIVWYDSTVRREILQHEDLFVMSTDGHTPSVSEPA